MTHLIRIELKSGNITSEEISSGHPFEFYGGRALIAKVLSDEVDPKSDELGEKNKLIISSGLLGGSVAPNSGRASIGAKSPLTHGIKESNVGGKAPAFMGRQDIRGLIFEGLSEKWVVIKIEAGVAKILDGSPYIGINNYELMVKLRADFGEKIGTFSIGVAGEKLLAAASVAAMDMEGYPSRHAGRGGMGAVMGSKKIKAIVVIPPKKSAFEYANPDTFKSLSKAWGKELIDTKKTFSKYGTLLGLMGMNEVKGLPTKNFRQGSFADAEKISGYGLIDHLEANGGKSGLACSPGCMIRCSNSVISQEGKHITSSLEYETVALNGSNLLIGDIEKLAYIDHACDDVGVDTIEMGNALGVYMDSGKLPWGDADGAIELINGINTDNPVSLILAQGTVAIGKHTNHDRIPQVKGQGIPGYDPRTFKGMGVTYTTSPMGADHTAAACIVGRKPYGDRDYGKLVEPEHKVELSKGLQVFVMIYDSTGQCYFIGPSWDKIQVVNQLLNARYGWKNTAEELVEMSKKWLLLEKSYNEKAGLNAVDPLPNFMVEEALEDTENRWDIPNQELNAFWEDFD